MSGIRSYCVILLSMALLVAVSAGFVFSAPASPKNFIIYFPNWGTYGEAHKNFTVGNIPWDKVTVINHAFLEVNNEFKLGFTDDWADLSIVYPHSEEDGLKGHFGEYKYYKQLYPQVKLLASVGGWTRGHNFHAMALTAAGRQTFADSCVEFLDKYPFFDGIDLDWEYPGVHRDPDPGDKYDKGCPGGPEGTVNFTLLLKDLRETFDKNGLTGKLLTAAIPAGYDKLALQQPKEYHKYLDFINVMTYDFHGAADPVTGHLSPLYANPKDTAPQKPVNVKKYYNTDYAMKLLVKLGVPKGKLNVGSPWYSRGWKNVDGNTGINGLFANANGGPVGNWDDPDNPGGQNSYFRLKEMETLPGFVKYRDEKSGGSPWLYNAGTGEVYTYEDEVSLAKRCDYIKKKGFGGIIVWEITGDDKDFTLTNLVYNKLIGSITIPIAVDDKKGEQVVVDDKKGGQVVNGTFGAAIGKPWFYWTEATAKLALENGEAKISIKDEGAEYWSVQFNADGIRVAKDQTYVLKFDARSTVPRDIVVIVEHRVQPFAKHYGPETVRITDKMTTYTYEYTQKEVSDDDSHIVFGLGKVGNKVGKAHDVFIDNVSFTSK